MSKPKLSNEQRMFALRLHAEGHPPSFIVRELKENYDVTISAVSIIQTSKAKKHQPVIKEFKERYLADVRAVPIANKRIRVDDMERERIRLTKLINSLPRKTKSDIAQYIRLVAELRHVISEAREEMEKKPHMFQNVVIGTGDMSDEALHRRKQELIRRLRSSVGGRASGADTDSGGIESEG